MEIWKLCSKCYACKNLCENRLDLFTVRVKCVFCATNSDVTIVCMNEVMFSLGPQNKIHSAGGPCNLCSSQQCNWNVKVLKHLIGALERVIWFCRWHINRPVLNFSVFSDRGTKYARVINAATLRKDAIHLPKDYILVLESDIRQI